MSAERDRFQKRFTLNFFVGRLRAHSEPGDTLVIEQVDRLSRLNAKNWEKLKGAVHTRRVRVVALDLPTAWTLAKSTDEMSSRMLDALNAMMLEMLSAIAHKDDRDRRRTQEQGIRKAKADGIYKGRKEGTKRNTGITAMLAEGASCSQVQDDPGCSRSTLVRLSAKMKDKQAQAV